MAFGRPAPACWSAPPIFWTVDSRSLFFASVLLDSSDVESCCFLDLDSRHCIRRFAGCSHLAHRAILMTWSYVFLQIWPDLVCDGFLFPRHQAVVMSSSTDSSSCAGLELYSCRSSIRVFMLSRQLLMLIYNLPSTATVVNAVASECTCENAFCLYVSRLARN